MNELTAQITAYLEERAGTAQAIARAVGCTPEQARRELRGLARQGVAVSWKRTGLRDRLWRRTYDR
jgi:predicted ArsR family transcriptional regulator